MKLVYFFICGIFFFKQIVYAQDQTNFTQFYLNPYLINPSYAGIDGRASVCFTYRNQWSTIPDGPRIGNFSLHTPASKRVSLGLSLTNDKKGIVNNSSALLTFGYNIFLQEHSFLRFGVSGGGSWNTIDLDKLEGFNDPALGNLLDNHASLNGNAGFSIHIKSFHGGVSLPVIFAPSYISKDQFTITEVKPFETLIAHASNRIYFANNKHVFEPYFIYRMGTGLPGQFEVAGVIHLNHVIWFGGSYKQDYGISALGGIKIKNTLAIGGSYSLKNAGINELNSPSYEVSLGILFGNHRKETPMYSFVNTMPEKKKKGTGKSASEMIAEKHRQDELARKKHQEELAKKKQQEELAKKQQAELAKKQQEELAKKQQEELAKKQQEELAKKQQQTVTQNQQEVAKQQPAVTQKPAEEVAKKQPEETLPKQQQTTQTVAQNTSQDATKKPQLEQPRQQEPVQKKEPTTTVAQTQTQTPVPPKEEPILPGATRTDTIVVTHRPRFNHIDASMEVLNIEITEHSEQDEKERISRLSLHQSDPDEHHEGGAHPNAERHEFVKRGKHKQELDVSDYVITGVFGQESNAKHFADGLKKLGFTAKFGHLTEKNLWYVYLLQTNDINQARTERDKYRKMKIFRDAWLLTVHN